MNDLVELETFADFLTASTRAKRLALQFQEFTAIARTDTGWGVLVSFDVLNALQQIDDHACGDDDDDWLQDSDEDDYQREVAEPLVEEFMSDQDDWARSEEEGWFYQ